MSVSQDGMRNITRLVVLSAERSKVMKVYFTVAGTNHYYGQDFIEPGMKVKLTKDKKNDFDKEAIKVEMSGLGIIGYVANSPYTVIGDSMSAGRMYDRIKKHATGTVVFVLPKGVLCELDD